MDEFEDRKMKEGAGKRPYLFLFSFAVLFLFSYQFLQQTNASSDPLIFSKPIVGKKVTVTVTTYPEYGVNFISWAKGLSPVSDTRYANAKLTGAGWNRWPMYWNNIEQSEGNFSWAYQDVAVENDLLQGLQIDAILLGTPGFYFTESPFSTPLLLEAPLAGRANATLLEINEIQAGTPQGLYESVFTDGTDVLGVGKQINPNNRWARFVATAVNRYKPGGVLAQQKGWPAGQGVTYWEMWNEPDLTSFWDGTTADYARLLKVGYLAAKQADPNAQVIFGGIANSSTNLNFYNNVMAIYDGDDTAVSNAYFHDIFATHNYLYSWRSWFHVFRAGNTLKARNLDKPIWLNETGVPVWDDYPGPICEPDSPYRATKSEQADFVIQSTFYARFVHAAKIFFFQLYDDCGNQPGGTDFAYYPPALCTGDPNVDKGGDAFGLFSNAPTSACYSDHPQPESAREGLAALQLLTTYFTDVEPLWRLPSGSNDGQEWIAFFQPGTNSRILGMWSKDNVERTALVPATNQAGNAILLGPDNNPQSIMAVNGIYTVTLPAATNQNAIWDSTLYPIEGRPYILIEVDDLPPAVTISAPAIAFTTIPLTWQGNDAGSGMQNYDLQVQMDDNPPFLWMMGTTETAVNFPAEEGRTYQFTIIARDNAGNDQTSSPVLVETIALPEKVYLPTIQR